MTGVQTCALPIFIRHHAARWNVLRHRIAPSIHQQVTTAQVEGRLTIHAGSVQRLERHGSRVQVHLTAADDQGGRPLPPLSDLLSSFMSSVTVAVRPGISATSAGGLSIEIRTGTRWARRTQLKFGLIAGSSEGLTVRSWSSIAPAIDTKYVSDDAAKTEAGDEDLNGGH